MIYILVNVAGLSGVAAFSWAIYKKEKTLLTFSNCFSFFWGISLLVNMTYADGLVRVSSSTLVVLYGAWWALLIGALLILRSHQRPEDSSLSIDRKRAFCILVLLLAMHVFAVWLDAGTDIVIQSTSMPELTANLAIARINGELLRTSPPLFLGTFRYAYVLYIPLLTIMWRKGWIRTYWFVIICMAAGITCLISFTRAPLVQLLVIVFVSLIVVFPERRSKFMIWGALLTVTAVGGFVSMEMLLLESDRGSVESLSDSLVSYCGAPMKAYDLLLKGEYPAEKGFYSFDMINYPLHRMGLVESYPSLVREQVSLPFATNVYTFLDAFTLDFGLPGALFGAFGIGVLVATVYRSISRTCYWGLTAYCLAVYYLIMADENNEFIRFGFLMYVALAWLIELVIVGAQGQRLSNKRLKVITT